MRKKFEKIDLFIVIKNNYSWQNLCRCHNASNSTCFERKNTLNIKKKVLKYFMFHVFVWINEFLNIIFANQMYLVKKYF